MKYIAEHIGDKWLLVDTLTASSKLYSEAYIKKLAKTHKINGVVNGKVSLANKQKIEIYLNQFRKPEDYTFYFKPYCYYSIISYSDTTYINICEFDEQKSLTEDIAVPNASSLYKILHNTPYKFYNLFPNSAITSNADSYYMFISENSLVDIDTFAQAEAMIYGNGTVLDIWYKANTLYIRFSSGLGYNIGAYNLLNPVKPNFKKDIPADSIRLR